MMLGLRSIHEVVDRYASHAQRPSGRVPVEGSTAPFRRARGMVLGIVLLAVAVIVLAFGASPAAAQNIGYFGKNRLEFSSVAPFLLPDATGSGIVDYKGGKEPVSRWRASFRFTGLELGASYTVVIRGRYGAAGSRAADSFTPLCSFRTDAAGQGGCFWYFRGLARLNFVQLQTGGENGTPVLGARRPRGPGSIETEPNRFSPGGEIPAHENS